MKKYYDKVLFLLALIVLGIGAAIFYFKEPKGGLPKSAVLPAVKLSGNAYAPIDKPKFETDAAVWNAPADQSTADEGWIYYVFTPPKIWWDPKMGWIPEPPEPPPVVSFGVHLVSAKKELYRIQLKGMGGSGDKDDDIIFSDLSDPDNEVDFHLKMTKDGAPVDEDNDKRAKAHEIQVKDIVFDQVDKGHGVVVKAAKVTILDTHTNETITLTQGEEYAPTDNQLYTLRTDDPFPTKDWKVSKNTYKDDAGLTFPGSLQNFKDEITFKVVALDFNTPSVTVEKQYTPQRSNKPVSLPKELTISSTPSPDQSKSSPTPASSPAPAN